MTPDSERSSDPSRRNNLREDAFETGAGGKIAAPGEEVDDDAFKKDKGRYVDVTA